MTKFDFHKGMGIIRMKIFCQYGSGLTTKFDFHEVKGHKDGQITNLAEMAEVGQNFESLYKPHNIKAATYNG